MAETGIYLNAYEFWFMVEVDKEIWLFGMFMFWMVYEYIFSRLNLLGIHGVCSGIWVNIR